MQLNTCEGLLELISSYSSSTSSSSNPDTISYLDKHDYLKNTTLKVHLKIPSLPKDQDKNIIIDYFKNIIRNEDVILLTDNFDSNEKMENILNTILDSQETLVIKEGVDSYRSRNELVYHLNLPEKHSRIKKMTLNLNNCRKINNLNYSRGLESIELNCKNLTEIDLSELNTIKRVRVVGASFLKIINLYNTNADVQFDFREVGYFSPETINLIKELEKNKIVVHYDKNIFDRAAKQGTIIKRPSASPSNVNPASRETNTKNPSAPEYNEKPVPNNQETNEKYTESTSKISLVNHTGSINPRRYRKQILRGMEIDKYNNLVFKPFSFNEAKSVVIDLDSDSIKMESSHKFNQELSKKINNEVDGSYLGIMSLSVLVPT